jgi:putative ABC transport system permease protein
MANGNSGDPRPPAVDRLWQDLRSAVRTIRQSPALTAAIVVTLALGVGANMAIFTVVNSLLLRPLPAVDPRRLVSISSDAAIARGQTFGLPWSFSMWQAFQPHVSDFDGALAWTPVPVNLAQGGERQPADAIFASGSYFATLGVRAILGRTFTASDDRPGGGADGAVAVIGHGLWQRRFGGDQGVIGARLMVDGVPATIVGVTGPEFSGVDVGRAFDVALPLATEPHVRGRRSALQTAPLLVMLRLKPQQSIDEGTAALRRLQPEILAVRPERLSRGTPAHLAQPFTLVSAATGTSLPVRGPNGLRQSYSRPLLTILLVALVVLLLACVNIANLLLARASARRYELGVRLAMGAPRARLVRQLLIESVVFSILGSAAGLVVAAWGGGLLVAQLSTPGAPIALDLSFDIRVAAFTATIAGATVVAFGVFPALRATRINPLDVLRPQAGGVASRAGGVWRLASPSGALVIVQVALSLALVVSAALLVRSFARLAAVPLGFEPDRVLVVNVDLETARTDPAGRMPLHQRILEATRRVPGVAHAGGAIWTPVDGGPRLGDSQARISFNVVTPGWFAAYGTPLEAGRDFTAEDTAGTLPVVIVNDAFVRAWLPGGPAIGTTIPHPRVRTGAVRTIVGVVADTVFETQRDGIRPIVYLPVAQAEGFGPGLSQISLGVRPVAGEPMQLARSVGAALGRVDPGLSFEFDVLTDYVQASVRQERLVAIVSGFFGALAVAIAALGLYGLTASIVTRRVTEIAIRRALGAQRAAVLRLVMRQILILAAAGIALGLAAAASATRYLGTLLFDLAPLDVSTFMYAAALFAAVAALAALLPARRAARIDPLAALRRE